MGDVRPLGQQWGLGFGGRRLHNGQYNKILNIKTRKHILTLPPPVFELNRRRHVFLEFVHDIFAAIAIHFTAASAKEQNLEVAASEIADRFKDSNRKLKSSEFLTYPL